ncbi:hypothetical protein F4677DRAFT_418689 [Hypoxylon crocopeplum]|nr:hypothetical protein F4677DRAFT_418689 [Hypoxylon crocopeplum]
MRSLILALPRASSGSRRNAMTKAVPSLQLWATKRTFSSLPSLRPTVLASANNTIFRPSNSPSSGLLTSFTPTPSSSTGILDLIPKTAITSHPALGSCAAQMRCGPRPTMARSSRLIRKRRHGFLSRIRTRNGRKILQRRKNKKRRVLSS